MFGLRLLICPTIVTAASRGLESVCYYAHPVHTNHPRTQCPFSHSLNLQSLDLARDWAHSFEGRKHSLKI